MKDFTSYDNWIHSAEKCDLHCHAARGAGLNYLSSISGSFIKEPLKFASVSDMNMWFNKIITPLFPGKNGYEQLIQATISEAIKDNVKILTLGFAIDRVSLYDCSIEHFIEAIKKIVRKYNNIIIIPELSIPKTGNYARNIFYAKEAIGYGFFKSIDIVGEELDVGFDKFIDLYRYAKNSGLRLRAHVGEFGNALSIRKTCELLELDEVQHGINAVESKEVINFLRTNQIQLNICPTSNIKMGLVSDYYHHPIRKLFDEGVQVTINTDDRSVFNRSVSDEYIALLNEGCFSIAELECIREETLQRTKMIWCVDE